MTPIAKKRPAAKRKRPRRTREARIRMYDVGFGDCFLLFLPTTAGEKKVLFDCGSIKRGANAMKDVVAALIDDIRDGDGTPRLDVVVCTHRHKDHVSGFELTAWEEVEVGEVWMPWTEDPDDQDATRIREMQATLALHLHATLDRQRAFAVSANSTADAIDVLTERALVAANALSNEAAMTQLHEGFAKRKRQKPLFLPAKSGDDTLTSAQLPGVSVYVMGPSRNEDVIRDMEPGSGESYLRAANRDQPGTAQPPTLFPQTPTLTAENYRQAYPYLSHDVDTIGAVNTANEDDLIGVLGALEKAVNGTSLMLMFRVGRTHLLFPGDAQWGTWREALNNPRHRALLGKTSFYKIGHHGSHNATPPEFVEKVLGTTFWAMASVKPVKNWPEIPRGPLLTALRKKSKNVARSDEPADAKTRGFDVTDNCVEIRIPIQ